MPDAREIVSEPEWLPLGFDRAGSAILFGRMTRAAASRAAFLDHRAAEAVRERARLPLDETARALPAGRAAPAFIFHTSFCCSTLLARALDCEGRVAALKEPNVLLDVANALRVDERLRNDAAARARLVGLVFALLARPARGERQVLVKPTNGANSLLPDAARAGAPILLLHGPLRDYLVSIIKKGEEGRAFVRQQFNMFGFDGGLGAIPQRQAMGLTDLQVAALIWRHQIESFAQALAEFPAARLAALDYRRLLAAPAAALRAAARHLDLDIPEAALDAAAAGDVFARDAKFADRAFDAARRSAEEESIAAQWGATLDLICGWADNMDLGVKASLPLARALSF